MKKEHDIFKTLKNKTLTDRERALLQSRLAEYRVLKPVAESTSAPLGRVRSPFSMFDFSRPMPLIASFFVLIFVGGGVAQAAEGAVPGDVLYPIKTAVTEEVRVAFAQSVEAKTEVEAWRAERRIEEAQRLALRANLSNERKERLEDNFNEHAERVEEHIASIGGENPELAAELAVKFEASLTAHEAILASLNTTATKSFSDTVRVRLARIGEARRFATLSVAGSEETTYVADAAVNTFSAKVAPLEIESASFMMAEEQAPAPSAERTSMPVSDTSVDREASAKRAYANAVTAIETTEKLYRSISEKLSAMERARIEAQIETARELHNEGKRFYEQGIFSDAYLSFQRVILAMNTLTVFLKNDTSDEASSRMRVLEVLPLEPPPEELPALYDTGGNEVETSSNTRIEL